MFGRWTIDVAVLWLPFDVADLGLMIDFVVVRPLLSILASQLTIGGLWPLVPFAS
jgi:hypothetical protein